MDWRLALTVVARHVRPDPADLSWCAWTTFERLEMDVGYWSAPVPMSDELTATGVQPLRSGAAPFFYCQLAHFIVPRRFAVAHRDDGTVTWLENQQDIVGLSKRLECLGVPHTLGTRALEFKLY